MFLRIVGVILAIMLCAGTVSAKTTVSIFWAEYDGDTAEYTSNLEKAFEKAHPDIDVKIIRTNWNNLHDRLVTFIAGKKEPDLSVIGTRWLLEFADLDVLEPIEKHLSKSFLNNFEEGAKEGKLGNVLYGLPMAMGPRLMYYRKDLVPNPPQTMEEVRALANKFHNPPKIFGIGMTGRKYTESTEFAYYLFANGGYYFDMNPDGSYGKCAVNSPAAVKALTFMNDMVNKDKVTQPGVAAYTRDELQDLFIAGKMTFFFSGAFTTGLLKKNDVPFKWGVAPLPPFKGHTKSSLLVTDSVVMFKRSKNKDAAGKFLEFFFKDENRVGFDINTGFPPVTKSLGSHDAFKTPTMRACVAATVGAKGWPLIAEWPQVNDIIWEGIESVFQDQATPQEAMDKVAAKVDRLRKIN